MSEVISEARLRAIASLVQGTEAAAFAVVWKEPGRPSLTAMAHIRPDDAGDEVRTAAIEAFSDMIAETLADPARQYRLFELGGPPDDRGRQFCLIWLIRDPEQVVAVAAVVTRCSDHRAAGWMIDCIRQVWGTQAYTI